jgi:hypothetical protein
MFFFLDTKSKYTSLIFHMWQVKNRKKSTLLVEQQNSLYVCYGMKFTMENRLSKWPAIELTRHSTFIVRVCMYNKAIIDDFLSGIDKQQL